MDPCLLRRRAALRRLRRLLHKRGAGVCLYCFSKLCDAHKLRLAVGNSIGILAAANFGSIASASSINIWESVSNIDKHGVATVPKLEALGYSYQGREWVPASSPARSFMSAEGSVMLGMLVEHADALEACAEGLDESQLKRIAFARSSIIGR
jgi:hypothetical protein